MKDGIEKTEYEQAIEDYCRYLSSLLKLDKDNFIEAKYDNKIHLEVVDDDNNDFLLNKDTNDCAIRYSKLEQLYNLYNEIGYVSSSDFVVMLDCALRDLQRKYETKILMTANVNLISLKMCDFEDTIEFKEVDGFDFRTNDLTTIIQNINIIKNTVEKYIKNKTKGD